MVTVNFPGGYFDGEGNPHYRHLDWQGSVTMTTDHTGELEQHVGYYPYGEPWREPAATHHGQSYLFSGKERLRDLALNDYDFTARHLNSAFCLFSSPDPLAWENPGISPFTYCAGNPIKYIVPSGCRPIYSTNGDFLGIDELGISGKFIIIDEKYFDKERQIITCDDAEKYRIPLECVPDDVKNKIGSHFAQLPARPDFDGKLTLKEANSWYNNGNGETLFVNMGSLDFSKFEWSEENVGQSKYYNLLFDEGFNIKDGLVYGTLELTRGENYTVTCKKDTYDFDNQKIDSFKTLLRNFATFIGRKYAGEGKAFDIKFYGRGHIKQPHK